MKNKSEIKYRISVAFNTSRSIDATRKNKITAYFLGCIVKKTKKIISIFDEKRKYIIVDEALVLEGNEKEKIIQDLKEILDIFDIDYQKNIKAIEIGYIVSSATEEGKSVIELTNFIKEHIVMDVNVAVVEFKFVDTNPEAMLMVYMKATEKSFSIEVTDYVKVEDILEKLSFIEEYTNNKYIIDKVVGDKGE